MEGIQMSTKDKANPDPTPIEPLPTLLGTDIKQVIAVMSGKGGVGKSSVAALFAVVLRQQGFRVGLLDADITGPSIPKMFGVTGQSMGREDGLSPVLSRDGIKLVSINLILNKEDDAVIWRGPLISRAIQQFWGDVIWGELDYLVVDLPPGTSDAVLTVMQSIPMSKVVLVTSPQDLAGMVVRKAANMARTMDIPILGLVENMSYLECPGCGEQIDVFGPGRALDTANQIGVPLLGKIPLDPKLSSLCDSGNVERYTMSAIERLVELVREQVDELEHISEQAG
jgi:Mrp family chromosome partitioning ATPase